MTETAATAVSQAVKAGADRGTQEAPQMNPERAKNKATFDQRVQDIRNHPELSDEAKQRYIAEAYEEHSAKEQALLAEEERAQEQEIAKYEQEVFSVPMLLAATTGEKIAQRQSYRDATFRLLDRLEAVDARERPKVLEELMERAARTGDRLMGRSPATTPLPSAGTGTSPTPTGRSILRAPSCDGNAFGGHRDPGAEAGAALG